MCGIYGYSGKLGLTKNDMRIALQKFKILGLYNEERGKDSCGVYVNNEVKKGVGSNKLFSSFIETEIFNVSSKNRIFLGHNRNASAGSQVNAENQHPFLIDDDMYITHNGTLRDTREFCEKYDLPWLQIDVDTIMLGMALHRHGPKVLETYKGFAALAYTFISKPNVLYLYHGASSNYKGYAEIEERPLFFMETKEGIYYSSKLDSLEAIREDEEQVAFKVEYNTVFEIKDGVFTGNNVKVNRGECNIESVKYTAPGRQGGWNREFFNGHGASQDFENKNAYLPFHEQPDLPSVNFERNRQLAQSFSTREGGTIPTDTVLSLSREAIPPRLLGDKTNKYIYFFRGRHWIHNPDGPNTLADEDLIITNNKGYVLERQSGTSKVKYFYKGYLLKGRTAWMHLKESLDARTALQNTNANFAMFLSKYTEFPVYDYEEVGKSGHRWYKDGKIADANFTPKFSARTYKISQGHLTDIVSAKKDKENCYYSSPEKASEEYRVYNNGGLMTDPTYTEEDYNDGDIIVPAIRSLGIIKQHISNAYDKDWWEKTYKTFADAKIALTKYEMMALDKYSRWFCENKQPFPFAPIDVSDKSALIVQEAVANGISIEESIHDDEGLEVLKKAWRDLCQDIFLADEMADKNKPVIDTLPDRNEGLINYHVEDEDDEAPNDNSITPAPSDMGKLEELVEETFSLIQELHSNANDLQEMAIEEAEEMAYRIYKLIDEFNHNCEGCKILQESQFKEFIEKIKKLKNGSAI